MATEKTFQSTLPDLLTQLLGTQTDSTSSVSANTGPLQSVFNSASTPMSSELYQQLISNIFTQAAQNVPTLTAAFANATGTRSRGNSGLSLALNQQNNEAAAAAAQAILTQQNKQAEIAGNAARGIADSTRTTTQAQKQGLGGGMNPLVMGLGGMLLNKADKGGWIDKMGSKIGDTIDSFTGVSSGPDLSYLDNILPSSASGFGGVGTDMGVSSFSNSGGSSFTDFLPSGDDLSSFFDMGDASGAIDTVTSGAGSAWDTISTGASELWDTIWPFADGGMPEQPAMRQQLRPSYAPAINNTVFGYADGGMPMPAGYRDFGNPLQPRNYFPTQVFGPAQIRTTPGRFADGGQPTVNEGRNLVRTGSQRIDAMENATMNGGDPNAAAREVIAQVLGGRASTTPTMMDLLLGIFNRGAMGAGTPPAYNGPAAGNPMLPQNRVNRSQEFADGGTIRNKNYMGAPQQRYGMNVFDGSDTSSGSGSNMNSTAAFDMISRATAEDQTRGSGGGYTYSGKMTDQDFADRKDARDAFGGLLPGEGSTLLGMFMSALNPSLFGMAKMGYDAIGNESKTQNAVDFVKNQVTVSPEQQAINEQQMLANEQDALAQMEAEIAAVTPDATPSYGGGGSSYSSTPAGQSVNANFGGASASESRSAEGGGGVGAADGGTEEDYGFLRGPGSGISDSIPAKSKHPGGTSVRLSNKEFIIPADVTAIPGMREHFESLIATYHTPVRR